VEAIFTQLVFEHSLRVRLNSYASTSDNEKSTSTPSTPGREASAASTVVGDFESVADVSTVAITEVGPIAEDAALRLEASQSTVIGSEHTPRPSEGGKEDKEIKKVEDQSGKIMNLLTSDIEQLTWGSKWQSPCKLPPVFLSVAFNFDAVFYIVKIGICTYFLYIMLGWRSVCSVLLSVSTIHLFRISALVGIACILITLPVPALVASLLMKIQVEKMQKVRI
jgi:hypothetical protein